MRWLKLLFELICYAGLAFVLSGIAAMIYISVGGKCPQFSTGGIKCATLLDTQIASYGMGVTLITVFTGFPGLLALGGTGFIIWRLVRRADARKKARQQA